jgi:raffinose/stachyose/melibiose transport system substrate-binding protein
MKRGKLSVLLMIAVSWCAMAEGVKEGGTAPAVPLIRILGRWSDNSASSVVRRKLVEDWARAHPGITVDDQSVNQEDVFSDSFKTALAVGDVPDIVMTSGSGNLRAYVENKVFVDLEPVLLADSTWSASFVPASFENWRFKGIPGTFGIPQEVDAVGLFCNTALFQKHGVRLPVTIEDFEKAGGDLLSSGVTPMLLGAKDKWRGSYLFTNLSLKYLGADVASGLSGRQIQWTNADVVQVLSLLASWNRKGILGPNPVSHDYEEEKASFLRGETAMIMDGTRLLGELRQSPVASSVTFLPFPYSGSRPGLRDTWLGGGSSAFSVSSPAGPRRAAAFTLVKWCTSMDSFRRIAAATGGGILPVRLGIDPSVESPISRLYRSVVGSAVSMRTELPLYDPLVRVSERVSAEIQGLFAGNSPRAAADAIQREIDDSRAQGLP